MRRTCGVALVGVLVAAVLALVAPATALACSCAPAAGLAERAAAADVVVTGRVRERSAPAGSSSADPVTWSLDVEQVFAGPVGAQQEVVTAADEASCGHEFTVGVTYVVLATGPATVGGPVTTGLCTGTRPATAGAVEELTAAGFVGAPPAAVVPPAAAPPADVVPPAAAPPAAGSREDASVGRGAVVAVVAAVAAAVAAVAALAAGGVGSGVRRRRP